MDIYIHSCIHTYINTCTDQVPTRASRKASRGPGRRRSHQDWPWYSLASGTHIAQPGTAKLANRLSKQFLELTYMHVCVATPTAAKLSKQFLELTYMHVCVAQPGAVKVAHCLDNQFLACV